MSTRDDARLTAQERAALASLEAVAAAEDPKLASRLRGAGRLRHLVHIRLPAIPAWARTRWWGVPLVVLGLLLAVLGMSAGVAVAVVGAAMAAAGFYLIALTLDERWRSAPPADS